MLGEVSVLGKGWRLGRRLGVQEHVEVVSEAFLVGLGLADLAEVQIPRRGDLLLGRELEYLAFLCDIIIRVGLHQVPRVLQQVRVRTCLVKPFRHTDKVVLTLSLLDPLRVILVVVHVKAHQSQHRHSEGPLLELVQRVHLLLAFDFCFESQ